MPEIVDLYRQAATWSIDKIDGATANLDAPTPCEKWDVRTLLNHMLETQQYFVASAQGREASPPSPEPPALISDNPAADFAAARDALVESYADPEVLEKRGFGIGVAFSDLLIHGWDVASATGQDTTMPDGLAQAAYDTIHGKFTDDQRKGLFHPEVDAADDADAQTKLLAYTGRRADGG
ncbi:MAG: hypothetical protein QOK28_3250 [Actinomycetota bacterium]|jgi:uncharacterized protein (TIGR03086 family)